MEEQERSACDTRGDLVICCDGHLNFASRVYRVMTMKLKRDSWYGKVLEHPTNWCGLVWGGIWRLGLGAFLLICGASLLIVMTVGNYYLVQYMMGSIHIMNQTEAIMNLAAAAVAFDIVAVICLIVACVSNGPKIADFVGKYTERYCPKVEWE